MEYPLEGIKILEWAIYHAGPGGSAILGDLGAEIVKIEQPGTGDPVRHRSRYGRTDLSLPGGRNLFLEGSDRNKKSITIDLHKEEGKQIVYGLVPHFDVFLTNIRRKTVEKAGMSYPILSEINPRMVYVSGSCYGPEGPDKDAGGFDFQGQARAGIMNSVGRAGDPPFVLHFALIDQAAAVVVSQAIMAALIMRQRTGKGQLVQTSVLGGALNLAYFNFLYGLWLKKDMPRHDRSDTDPLRNYYCGSDGRYFIISVLTDNDWSRFCGLIGRPELADDPRFDSDVKRGEAHSRELVALLDEVFATRPGEEWINRLGENDIFVAQVNQTSELCDDPQIRANYLDEIEHPYLGKVPVPAFPARFSGARAGMRKAAPSLGEDTEQVLREFGGYSADEIRRLKTAGVV